MITDRRSLLTAAVVLAAAPAVAMAQQVSTSMPSFSGVRTHKQFAMGVMGPAEFSLATSQIAVGRATRPDAREFAGFELTEAIAVTTVLKELGTPVPPMSSNFQATLAKIKSASTGVQFDEAYIDAQYDNHVFLRDLAIAYLANSSASTTNMGELQGRHLATLALATFKEHTIITHRIAGELRA